MSDPYRYFRIEARELVDELTQGLAALRAGQPTADVIAALLRHSHTLKGAARVVSQSSVADHTHTLEGLLGRFRGSSAAVGEAELEEMLEQVEEIGDLLRALAVPAGEVPASGAAESVVSAPREADRGGTNENGGADDKGRTAENGSSKEKTRIGEKAGTGENGPGGPEIRNETRTARASLAEIDAVIDGVGQTRTQLSVLRDCVLKVAALSESTSSAIGFAAAVEAVQLALTTCADRMDRELRQVHDVAERLRLVPVTSIVPDLEGAARDVAAAQGKRVHVEVGGGQLRLDAPVLAAVQGALRQIVRNAVAHGIEVPAERVAAGKPPGGRVRLDVTRVGGQVVFSCVDDGRGIDLEAVRRQLEGGARMDDEEVLAQLSRGGVSTADTVSEVSGRGIGLDLVHDTAVRLGGRVEIRTRPGAGTTIDLTAPLSLSAQEVLVVDDVQTLALPLAAVTRTVRVGAGEITSGLRGEALRLDGEDLPFLPLSAALGDDTRTAGSQPAWSALVLRGRSGQVALGVSRLVGTTTIAIRPLPPLAPVPPVVTGLWLDVDAHPQLVLDADVLIETAAVRSARPVTVAEPLAPILVVDDSLTTRMLEQSVLESAGYRVELAASAEEGLLMAARSRYCLALVDVEMPGMTGFEFVEQTRARPELQHLPCILVTSRASAEDRRRGLDAGARAHIDKREFHQGTLLARIAEVLEG
jgi:two-component system, chemotaxis family, sensor kinase CheA